MPVGRRVQGEFHGLADTNPAVPTLDQAEAVGDVEGLVRLGTAAA